MGVLQQLSEKDVLLTLSSTLNDIDEDMISYLSSMICELSFSELSSFNEIHNTLQPFLESCGCEEEIVNKTCTAIVGLAAAITNNNNGSLLHSSSKTKSVSAQQKTQQQKEEQEETKKLTRGVSMLQNLEAQTSLDREANEYMLWAGKDVIRANANDSRDAHTEVDSAKAKRAARKELEKARREYEAKVQQEQEEEKQAHGVATMMLPQYNTGRNEKDIQVSNVSLSLDNGTAILDDADLKFPYKRRLGLVGKNGVGKTTLLRAIAKMEIPNFPRHHRVLHVRQEVSTSLSSIRNKKQQHGETNDSSAIGGNEKSVLQLVMDADVERNTLLQEMKELSARLELVDDSSSNANATSTAEQPSATPITSREKLLLAKKKQITDSSDQFSADIKRLEEVYARLSIIGADAAEARAALILTGLQFTQKMQTGPLSALSGGWKMRVSLAAALFIEPDLLMLDEPTNHLDLEAVLWLESYLLEYKHTIVVVSHDRGFLNEVCTDIIEFKDLKLTYYKGNFETYLKTSAENIRNRMREYQAYQDKRAHMMEFIDKFRYNAKRATLVQSRIKTVEKMDAEAPAEVTVEPVWRFSIPNPEPLGRPIISIDDVYFDYDSCNKSESEYLLQKVNFGVDLDSKVGVLGPNGAGKSTLVNLIVDKIKPVKGNISRNSHLRIGHFTQHSADKFNLGLSATENMLSLYENAMDQEMRSFLGRFQIQGADALKPMMLLSGGQKSRVAFAALAYQKPHVIVLDEPSNHLDMESIDALVEALSDFRGGLICISHDQYFITKICSHLVVVGDGKVTPFPGGFIDYKKHTLLKTAKRVAESVKSLSTVNN